MRRPVLAALVVLAATAMLPRLAAAQGYTATPGADCHLLTATQASGLVCATAPQPDPPVDNFTPSEDACRTVDTYREPQHALACAAWWRTQPGSAALPVYQVGAVYAHPYPSIRMVVLSVTLALDGATVVTSQFVAGIDTGTVFAFKVNEGQPWTRIQP